MGRARPRSGAPLARLTPAERMHASKPEFLDRFGAGRHETATRMLHPQPENQLESLLSQAGWIRALARELVADPDLVDEIEQRTLLAGIGRAPSEGVALRSWLARVVRNFARQALRAASRRARHEELAARRESQPSASELVERAAVQRALVDAVMALREPYRTTVLLRFYEGMPPRAVASRLGVPVDTVRTRTARALAQLRERLDAHHAGARGAWLSALVPLLPSPAPNWIAPALLMNTKLKLAAAALVALGIATYVATRESAGPATLAISNEAPVGASPKEARERATPASIAAPASESREVEGAAAATPAPEAHPALANLLERRGRVLDATGRPLAGVHVGWGEPRSSGKREALAVSGEDGSFRFVAAQGTTQNAGARLVACESGWTTVLAGNYGSAGGGPAREAILVLAHPRELAGSVVDEAGAPLADASIEVTLDEAFRTRLREILDTSATIAVQARSDERGEFALHELADLADSHVRVRKSGFLELEARLIDLAPRTVLTLVAPREAQGVLRGKVVDPGGTPLPKARVAFGIDTSTTDERGEFAFQLDDPRSLARRFGVAPANLSALMRGYQPASFAPPLVEGKPAWPAYVTLQLGAPTLEISGRVLDPEGAPLAGAAVWLMDSTFFGGDERGPLHVENLLGTGDVRGWKQIETGADGSFVIDGLLERDYHVEALDRRTLQRIQEGPFRAGAREIELRFPRGALHPRVAGRIVSHRGAPVAGARIFPMCDAFRTRVQGRIVGTSHTALEGTRSDADGRFELANVPKELVYVRIEGDDILPLEYCRAGEGDDRFVSDETSRLPAEHVEELVIQVALRCHVQIALGDPTSADEVEIVDAHGAALELNVYDGDSRETHERFPVREGRSAALAVSDAAAAIVLYKAGVQVARLPVELTPGPLREVKF